MPYKCTYKSVQTAIQSVQIDVQHKTRLDYISKSSKMTTKEINMKTLKISKEVHQELQKIKIETNCKTLSEAIDFLINYRKRVIIVHEQK